ncbi:hypothetical protein MNB_SV-3-1071 [hydrothermal vent metagenome]|uniref:Uracil-DNA glycosylase-like domain-containing protein n=1 Tax=hydrothermal vent metagenome TaxID=652676 RepID=A0A1W1C6J1_9ZZZZ
MFANIINKLRLRPSTDTVFNPYQNEAVANNLKLYFEYLYSTNQKDVLLIGEAPGYAGCRITGIPFTSGELFRNSELEIFKKLNQDIFLEKIEGEKTASIVWNYLENKSKLPVFWNSFPFHPFNTNNEKSNRTPTNEEIEEGKIYIQELVEIFKPKIIASIGRKGEKVLKNIYPNNHIIYIRHPSYGGKSDFIRGMDEIL